MDKDEPHCQVVIETHYNPTVDAKATDHWHERSYVFNNFVTGL